MSEIAILTKFKTNLIEFLDDLIGQFPNEGELVIARIFLKDQVPIVDVMSTFIQRLLPYKHMVRDRDEDFFIQQDVLFGGLRKDTVNHFKRLWKSGQMDDEDRQTIWKWFDRFILLAERYQKIQVQQALQS